MNTMPVFAVIGHPNEGKSSVVATLVENDQIRISPRPGETVESRTYPVAIDGHNVIAFVDTPGFQMAHKNATRMKMPECIIFLDGDVCINGNL